MSIEATLERFRVDYIFNLSLKYLHAHADDGNPIVIPYSYYRQELGKDYDPEYYVKILAENLGTKCIIGIHEDDGIYVYRM